MQKKIIAITAVVLVIAVLAGVYFVFGPNAAKGDKHITIEIIGSDWSEKYEIDTDAEYLEGAMKEIKELGFETKDGMVMVINGERADYVLDKAYWAIYVDGEYGNFGIAEQPLIDGGVYKLEYTKI